MTPADRPATLLPQGVEREVRMLALMGEPLPRERSLAVVPRDCASAVTIQQGRMQHRYHSTRGYRFHCDRCRGHGAWFPTEQEALRDMVAHVDAAQAKDDEAGGWVSI